MKAKEKAADNAANNVLSINSNDSINSNVSQESEKDFSYLSLQAVKNVEKFDYHIKRGLTNETLRRFGCGYLPPGTKAGNTKLTKWWWLFFPTGKDLKSGNARFIGDKDFRNFGGKDIFNFQALNSEIVIVVESEICAMTIYQETDAPVVALSGTTNTKKFIKHVENLDRKPRIIIVLTDNDGNYGEDGERPSKGKGAAREIIEAFNDLHIFTFDAIKFLKDCKDPNEFFLKYGAQKFKERIELILNRAEIEYTNFKIYSPSTNESQNVKVGGALVGHYQKPKKEGFYTTDDVAKILGVDKRTVRRWRESKIFLEDIQDHNGVYWYSIERVEQLKSVYRNNEEQYSEEKNISESAKNCPLPFDQIILPDSFKFDFDNNITLAVNNVALLKKLFNSIMIISKRFINVDTGIEKVEIATIKPHFKRWKSFITERKNIASRNKIVDLASYGLDVTSSRSSAVVNYFDSFEQYNSQIIPSVMTVSSTGWRDDDSFVFPNSKGDFDLDDSIKPQLDKIFQIKGNKQIVIDLLKKHYQKSSVFAVVGAALAAPLIKIFKVQNIVIHIYGHTGCGKSTLNKLAFSLFGDSNANGALFNADSTKVARENLFASRRDLIAIIEDLDTTNDEKTKRFNLELPYQFVNMFGRGRGKKTGGLDIILVFRGVLVTNGEGPLTQDNTKGGAKRRIIEIKASDLKNEQIFSIDEVSEINSVISDNYGLFGRDWINFIINHKKEMIDTFKKFTTGNSNFFKRNPNKVPLHINSIAAIAVAWKFFLQYFLDFDENDAEIIARMQANLILRDLPDNKDISDAERAKNIVRDWINSHPKFFIKPNDDNDDESQAEAFETYGIIKDNYIAVFTSKFKQMLTDNGFNADMVIRQLADDGFIIRNGKNLEKPVRVNKKLIRMIVIDKKQLEI